MGRNSAIPLQKIEASLAREKEIWRGQNEKSKEDFSVVRRMSASGGGAASFVGGFPKMRSDFVQGVDAYKKLTTIWSWGRLADKNTAGCSGCHLKTFYCPLERRS